MASVSRLQLCRLSSVFCWLLFTSSSLSQTVDAQKTDPTEARTRVSPSQTIYDQEGISIAVTETAESLEFAVSEPDPILASIEIDRNRNGQYDRLVDVAYRPQSNGIVCPQYLIDSNHNTPCGSFSSAAYLKDFKDELGRRQFVLVLPKTEISFDKPSVKLALIFRNTAQQNTFFYPIERFGKPIEITYSIEPDGTQAKTSSGGNGQSLSIPATPNRPQSSGSGIGFGPEDGLGAKESANGEVYRIGGNISSPVPLYTPEAEYSEEARKAKYGGVVLISLIVDAQGDPQSVRVTRPLGMGLDEKALEAVRHYKFTPAMKDGKTPVPARMSVEVNFRIGAHALDNANLPRIGAPTDPKAIKIYQTAIEWEEKGDKGAALDAFRKANKQDGGHCSDCLGRAYEDANALNAFKEASEIAREWLPLAASQSEKAAMHFRLATALQKQCLNVKKDECFTGSIREYKAALDLAPSMAIAHYGLGISLAYLHQDDDAKSEFRAFLNQDRQNSDLHERVERFLDRVELARARMAPAFSVVTLDGQRISLDGLAGKVVLVDFWATWCAPCRNALPHMREIARKFSSQPFVMLSISLDSDEIGWRDFIDKNGMTWLQYRDGGFGGQVSRRFNVKAIPATFSIDADGVLEDQRVGDAEIEGKLKKLVTKATVLSKQSPTPTAVNRSGAGTG